MTDLKSQVKGILEQHVGRDQAIPGRELARLLGQRDDRKIRLIIRELIAEGLPIVSATDQPAGYFLPLNWQEVRACIEANRSRLIEDAKRIRDLKHAAELYLAPAQQGALL